MGEIPSARRGHCSVAYGEEMLIFGGSNQEGIFNDLYILDLKYVKKIVFYFSVFLEKDTC